MNLKIVYKTESEHARAVTEFLHEFRVRTSKEIEEVNPDTVEGAQLCKLYDVTQYPTVIALKDDGQLESMWSGEPLPLIDEVSYYA